MIDDTTTQYFYDKPIQPVDIIAGMYPGFMTDWQAPWASYDINGRYFNNT